MTFPDFLINISYILVFSMGLGVLTRKGLFLWFLHYPFSDGEFGVMPIHFWIKKRQFKRKMEQLEVERKNAVNAIPKLEGDEFNAISSSQFAVISELFTDNRKRYYESQAKKWNWLKTLSKPIVRCPVCFASFHGSIIFWGYNHFIHAIPLTLEFYFFWVLCCIGATAVNSIGWYYLEDKI